MRAIKNNRNVENAWEMLKYLYHELRTKKFKTMDITKCKSLDDLYALVIATWCTALSKEGLYKEYVIHEDEELTSPRGQINIQETITRQSMKRGVLVCSYDELSEDIYLNHVLKGTLQYLLYDSSIGKLVKLDIKKSLQMFNSINYIDIKYVKWKNVKYNNSNIRYKHLLEMCKTYIDEHKVNYSCGFSDDTRMYVLFKKQILKYINIKYGEIDKIELVEMPFTLKENQFEIDIFKLQKMIVISTDNQALMIMVRLQDDIDNRDPKLPKARLEELVVYLREYKKEHKINTAGAILYINTDETKLNLQPITVNNIDDYMVGETIIDIHDQWRFIENKISDTYKYFIERDKNKNSKIKKKST